MPLGYFAPLFASVLAAGQPRNGPDSRRSLMRYSDRSGSRALAGMRVAFTVALLTLVGTVGAGTLREEAPSGSNPGNLRMHLYLPEQLRDPGALVVVLHGCAQGAPDYAVASGWVRMAERGRFLLLLPEQKRRNNWARCFNWFRSNDNRRDVGEARSIHEMIRHTVKAYSVDRRRVFITGVSAGGTMANVMLASYPELFRGGGLFAAVPYGCAHGLFSAISCMLGWVEHTAAYWGTRVEAAAPGTATWPDVAIWQGESDRLVDPHNARELEKQWLAVHGLEGAGEEESSPAYVHRVFADARGRIRVETYLIRAMGHGVPIDPGERPTQCGEASRFFPDVDVCASYRLARAWGLDVGPESRE